MSQDPTPAAVVEACRLVRENRMIEASKVLRASGLDYRQSKEVVERIEGDVDPQAAADRENWLDAIIRELGTKDE